MNIFVFTHGLPALLPRVFIDNAETICGVFHNNLRIGGKYKYMNTPGGTFDCQALLAEVRAEDYPNTILVHTDGGAQCAPVNLPDHCVKILLIGGATHFGEKPLQKMVQYVHAEKFDAIFFLEPPQRSLLHRVGISKCFLDAGSHFCRTNRSAINRKGTRTLFLWTDWEIPSPPVTNYPGACG